MLDQSSTPAAPGSGLSGSEVYEPPKIPTMPNDASFFRKMRTTVTNPIAGLPEGVYDRPYVTMGGDPAPVAFIMDPSILEEMLIKRWKEFPKTPLDHRVFKPLLGEGLLSAEGDDWKWKRRLAAPTFAPAALARMAPAMVAPFETLAAKWAEPAPASGAPGARGRDADVDQAMVDATILVIERILFADPSEMDLAAIAEGTSRYLAPMGWVELVTHLGLPASTPYPGRWRQMRARDEMRRIVGEAVIKRRAAVEGGAEPQKDLTGALLAARDPETDRPLSDEDMVDMLLTLVGAGHETSAHTLSWMLYCLAHQPGLQDELAAEAREVAASREGLDADAPFTAKDIPALARTEAALKEVLRLFPVAPLIARRTTREEQFGELRLKAGAFCVVPIYALQRSALHWERPDTFDIGRWLNRKEPSRTLYMPFGAGPRVCIGVKMAMMEMILGVATMLRKVRFEPTIETECAPVHRVTMRPQTGMMLNISPRD
ncbi:MAG: cytochrome P450 [Pseudomonadota bacterium]